MNYYVDVIKTNKNNATLKAPCDIAKICKELDMMPYNMPDIPYNKSMHYQKMWMLFVWQRHWYKLLSKMKKGDILLYQHPMYGTRLMQKFLPKLRKKGVKVIMLIHDLNILRGGESYKNDKSSPIYIQDMVILGYADKIICHNEKMRQYLLSEDFDESKLISLEIFDYLINSELPVRTSGNKWSCVIAGNLVKAKCKYIYDLIDYLQEQDSYMLHLYGGGLEMNLTSEYRNVIYHGSISPDKLPEVIEGDFGIVWDGTSIKTCEGNNGIYLKYNNPHKTSLFLASGIPVIVWKHSALANFVEKHGVGLTVESLEDIASELSSMTTEEYNSIVKNVQEIASKIKRGYFFRTAYEKAVNSIFDEENN